MSQFFQIHAENPQPRLTRQACDIIRSGGVVVYPTDSGYALGCELGNKSGADRIKGIRHLDDKHYLTLVCKDLSELSLYAKVNNSDFRLIKHSTPGPYTFILKATSDVPRRLVHPKRRQIGIRVPDNRICQALLEELGAPMMSATLAMPGEELPEIDPYDIRMNLEQSVDLIIDGGYGVVDPTTVIDMTGDSIEIVRVGGGNPERFRV